MHRKHTVRPAERIVFDSGSELDVALVTRNDDAGGTASGDPLEVTGVSATDDDGFPGSLIHTAAAPDRRPSASIVEVEVPESPSSGTGTAQASEGVAPISARRVGNRRVENGVEIGTSQPEELRERDDHLLRTDARRCAGATSTPVRRAIPPAAASWNAAFRRGWISHRPRRLRRRPRRRQRDRVPIDGVPIRQSTTPPERVGKCLQGVKLSSAYVTTAAEGRDDGHHACEPAGA